MSYTYTKRITYICAFCHVRIDGTVYSRKKRQMHRVCWEIDGEKQKPKKHVFSGNVFRMSNFSGRIGLNLRAA